MSHQKMLFALCLVASIIAISSGQRFDPLKCSQNVRSEIDRYSKSLSQSVTKLTQRLTANGQEAANLEPFQQDANKLVSQLTSLGDFSNGLDGGKIMSTYFEIVQTQFSLFRNSLRLSLLTNSMGEYVTFTSEMMSANTQFFQNVSGDCVPSRRRQQLP